MAMKNTTKAAKPEASVPASERQQHAAAATLSLPEQTEQGAIRGAMLAAVTPEQFLAAADSAARYGVAADATAWEARCFAALNTGEGMYNAYRATLLLADANVIVKPAADVPFSAIMSTLYGAKGGGTKAEYEALAEAKRPGPGKRGWSTLDQAYAIHQRHTSVRFAAYMLSVNSDTNPSLHGLLTSLRNSAKEAKRATDAGETPAEATASTKRTNAARDAERAAAEAKRIAEAKTARDAEAKRLADEAATKRQNVVTAMLRHVAEHPSANLVGGVDLTCAAAAALSVDTLRSLADALSIIADEAQRLAAVAAEATKGASVPPVAPAIDAGVAAAEALLSTEAEVETLGTEAEHAAADVAAADVASIVAAVMAQMAAAKV